MHTKYYYKRVDVPGDTYDFLALQIGMNLLFSDGQIVLKQYRRRKYFVVEAYRLKAAAMQITRLERTRLDRNGGFELTQQLAEAALHQTAEKFDTLEQAMLYFEMIRT